MLFLMFSPSCFYKASKTNCSIAAVLLAFGCVKALLVSGLLAGAGFMIPADGQFQQTPRKMLVFLYAFIISYSMHPG